MSGISDPSTADFDPSLKPDKKATRDEKWTYLQKAVAYIMGHPEGIADLGPAAINMYTVVFDFCHNKNRSPWVQYPPKAPLLREPELSDQLYERLVDFLDLYFEDIFSILEPLHGLELLAHYAAQFDRASASANQLDRVFNYLNRQRLCHNPDSKHFGKYENSVPTQRRITVKATVFDAWRNNVLAQLQRDSSKFTSALLDIVHQRSENTGDDANVVKRMLESLIALDDQLSNPVHQSTLYHDHFQSRFLSEWDSFCLSKQTEIGILMGKKVEDSLVQPKDVLQLEMDRMAKYLPECTQKEMLARVEKNTHDKSIAL
ncbi:hypothetical protein D9619_000225 [Psilocybe cf. subviscida]|uniref:Cullin N-terminal domain-containing protein n=1 Tax=Psilocybe cf. subviscida TaxID=2480587 RepID=A0A8H5F3Q1_9AGAR|nr:hypothetical protein D9619_000225 [Psilocybe cf. subviscida]